MTRRSRLWQIAAGLFVLINVGGAAYALRAGSMRSSNCWRTTARTWVWPASRSDMPIRGTARGASSHRAFRTPATQEPPVAVRPDVQASVAASDPASIAAACGPPDNPPGCRCRRRRPRCSCAGTPRRWPPLAGHPRIAALAIRPADCVRSRPRTARSPSTASSRQR